MKHDFWEYIQIPVDSSEIEIDRPRGSYHPRFPNSPYPVDYGYLKQTITIDAGGVDIFVGSLGKMEVVGILCTVDLLKRDSELKIVLDCKEEEIRAIIYYINHDQMRAIYIPREIDSLYIENK